MQCGGVVVPIVLHPIHHCPYCCSHPIVVIVVVPLVIHLLSMSFCVPLPIVIIPIVIVVIVLFLVLVLSSPHFVISPVPIPPCFHPTRSCSQWWLGLLQ